MSLSKELQSPEILAKIVGKSPADITKMFLSIGQEWYSNNSDESKLIAENLKLFGLENKTTVEKVQEHIVLHYVEKVLPLSGSFEQFADFIDANVDTTEAKAQLAKAAQTGGTLMATPHFGAVELAVPTVSRLGFTANAVLKFSTPHLSEKAQSFAKGMENTGKFSQIKFVEIGKPGVISALEMSAAIKRDEILFSVFDEETNYSTPVNLFNQKVMGGAGLDRLLKFTKHPVTVFNVFLVRTGDQKYKMVLKEVFLDKENIVQQMYDNLQSVLSESPEQWYFLHEEIPLAK
jgi:lauroyl/myristoyl acyltransferase